MTLNDDHQWTENEEVGVSGLLDHSDQVLMIQVLTEQSSYAWSYGGVTSSLIPITEDGSYFPAERGFRSLSRLNTQTEVTVGKPVPLLLIREKNEGPDGRTTMDVNDIAQSLEHPEQVDADRALLITVTFK